jgi:hypothetical protein
VERQRRLRDDVRWALAVLAGCALGTLVLGADGSILLGAVVGAVVVVVVRIALRRLGGRAS